MISSQYRKKTKRKVKVAASVISVVILCGVLYYVLYGAMYLAPRLLTIDRLISTYIVENNGKYPSTREALEEGGIIKKDRNSDGSYSIRDSFDPEKWSTNDLQFDRFDFAYGVALDDLTMKDEVLVMSSTGQEVFLITGPLNHPWNFGSMRSRYRALSVAWYEKMRTANKSRLN